MLALPLGLEFADKKGERDILGNLPEVISSKNGTELKANDILLGSF